MYHTNEDANSRGNYATGRGWKDGVFGSCVLSAYFFYKSKSTFKNELIFKIHFEEPELEMNHLRRWANSFYGLDPFLLPLGKSFHHFFLSFLPAKWVNNNTLHKFVEDCNSLAQSKFITFCILIIHEINWNWSRARGYCDY